MVFQWRALVPTPPFHQVLGMGPAGEENVERYRGGVRVGAPLGQASVGWEGNGGRSGVFAHDESRVYRSRESPPPEDKGEDSEGEEGGPGPP